VASKLKDLDIGLLVLNAGIASFGPFQLIRNDDVQN